MSQFSRHIKESFVEIFTDELEAIACWLTAIFIVVFCGVAIVFPVAVCCKYNWSNYWFLTYIGLIPLIAILITFTANWMYKLYNE